ncbi:MAG: sugar ABC transporter permease [Alphaproteobacteria bacterium]|jgi:multiple sugar transport system permease protein|nr:sugar ABC transporter permease [Alphaproteobacteria bacterium]
MSSESTRSWRGRHRSGRKTGKELSAGRLAVVMNLPSFVLMAVVLFFPLCYAAYLSISKVRIGQLRRGFPFPYYGWENYVRLFEDDLFLHSLQNTFVFSIIVVVTEVILGLAIALLINQQGIWLSRVSRVLVLLPYAIPPIANGLIWVYIYNFKLGFLNRVLFQLGLIEEYINWTGVPETALYSLTVPYVWRTLPFAILLFHAALQSLPQEPYEAAKVDGANAWQCFWHITLPMMRPIIAVVVILRTSFAFLVFDEVLALTQGGPGDATWVASWFAYKKSFAPPFNIGLGSASAYVLALLIAIMAILYLKFLYRRVE